MVDDEFLTVDEVAVLLKVNPQTVRNNIDRGDLPAVRFGRRVRIRRTDLETFITPKASRPVIQETDRREALTEALVATQSAETDAELAEALRLVARAANALGRSLESRSDGGS